MITTSWYLLLVMFIIAGTVFELPWLVLFSSSVLVLLVLANLMNRYALKDVLYKRVWHYRRGFSGEQLPVRIEMENQKLLPLSWLRVTDPWPKPVGPADEQILAPSHIPGVGNLVNLYSLRWFQRATRSYTLLLRQRGVYQVGPYTLDSGDLFGIYQTREQVDQTEIITVFPDLIEFNRLNLPTDDPFGDRRSRRRLFEDPNQPLGIRAYHPEDDFRRVHWPATARTGSLQVKVYQPVSSQVMVVCLDVTTMPNHWLGTDPVMLEHLVKVSATVVYQGVQAGYAVGLYSNGCLAHADQPFRIPPGRSPRQLAFLLQALAGVTSFITGPFTAFLMRTMSQIPYGATLVLVTAFVTPELTETVQLLKRYRAHITVICLGESCVNEIPGVSLIYFPVPAVKP